MNVCVILSMCTNALSSEHTHLAAPGRNLIIPHMIAVPRECYLVSIMCTKYVMDKLSKS